MYQFWPFQLTTWRNVCNNVVKSNLNKIQQEQLLTHSGTDGKAMIRFGCDKNYFIFNLGWVWFTCAPQGPRLYFVVFVCKSFKGGGHKLWTVVSSCWTKALLLNVVFLNGVYKHRQNCECCPGHHLIVNRLPPMSWFKFRNLSVIVNSVTKSLIH